MTQRQLVRQETFEQCMLFRDSLAAFAEDLESLGSVRDAEDLRSLAGEVENTYYRIRDRHKKRRD